MKSITLAEGAKKNLWLKQLGGIACLSGGYLGLSYLLLGFKTDQLVLVGLVNLLYLFSASSRKFISGFSPFVLFWVLYDYMKAFPNYRFKPVHIQDLYDLEKSLFGIRSGAELITPNEFWLAHGNTFLDVLSGFFYLSWIPLPIGFALYLFYRNRTQFVYFTLSFLLLNLLGFAVYYLYPAAPPWYVQQQGFQFVASTPGNVAGLAGFDAFFGISLFETLYAKGSNVFAAMPSLHSAYPLLVFYFGIKNRLGRVRVLFGVIMLGIWFAAVYTSHHYVLDVLAGILCACASILLFEYLLQRKGVAYRSIQALLKAVH